MFKKLVLVALVCVLILCSASVALAAQKPSLHVEKGTWKLHPAEMAEVKVTIKNADGATFAALPDPLKITYSKADIVSPLVFDELGVGTAEMKLTLVAGTKEGKTTVKIPFVLSTGKTLTLTLTVYMAENFAPVMRWHHILIDEKTGYPEIKLSMSDDFGLTNVCFIRQWTDENGVNQREIYDIYSLGKETEAVRYRTLRKPGQYSLQINDGTKKRYNSKVLVTVLDIDSNGVVDTYYIDDPLVTSSIQIEGAITLPTAASSAQ